MFQVYDYTNDKCLGIFADYDEADITCDEYVSNYCEPVEVCVLDLDELD
jgi:hypothetical protein